MDLISITVALWRHKLLTIPIIVLTCLGSLYFVILKAPVYASSSSVLLTNPPQQPTQAQMAADPRLARISSYNSYTIYGTLTVLANTVIDYEESPVARPALLSAGVIPGFQLELSTDYGNPPIIVITGVGHSARGAQASAQALTTAIQREIIALQKERGTNSYYMITGDNVIEPFPGKKSSSSATRSAAAVLAMGVILLFIVVSAAESVGRRSQGRGQAQPQAAGWVSDPLETDDQGRRGRVTAGSAEGRRNESARAR